MPRRTKNVFANIDEMYTELEGPYQCPVCGGHVMLDATYLDQVVEKVNCPYCKKVVRVPEE